MQRSRLIGFKVTNNKQMPNGQTKKKQRHHPQLLQSVQVGTILMPGMDMDMSQTTGTIVKLVMDVDMSQTTGTIVKLVMDVDMSQM